MFPSVAVWTRFFYFSHIFNIAAAIGFVASAYFVEKTEVDTVGEFDLHICISLAMTYYVTSAFIVLASVIGFFALKLSNKPGLWILYCILMLVLVIIQTSLSGTALTKVGNHNTPRSLMKLQMEKYITEDSPVAEKWDRLHEKHECCGVDSYKEWQDVPYGRTTLITPKSCCLPPNNKDLYCSLNVLPEHDQADKFIYTQGCLEPMLKKLDTQLTILGLLTLAVALMNIAIMCLTCFLVVTKKV